MYNIQRKKILSLKNKKIFVFIQKRLFMILKPYYCLLIGN